MPFPEKDTKDPIVWLYCVLCIHLDTVCVCVCVSGNEMGTETIWASSLPGKTLRVFISLTGLWGHISAAWIHWPSTKCKYCDASRCKTSVRDERTVFPPPSSSLAPFPRRTQALFFPLSCFFIFHRTRGVSWKARPQVTLGGLTDLPGLNLRARMQTEGSN